MPLRFIALHDFLLPQRNKKKKNIDLMIQSVKNHPYVAMKMAVENN